MIRKFLGRCYHACWYIAAAIILTTAVTVTLTRLALPRIDYYHDGIQNWIAAQVGYPVKIDRISADWQGWTPYVYLHEIEVLDPHTKTILTRLESASLSLNPFMALVLQQLSPLRITITGPELLVVRNADGAISIAQGSSFNSSQYQNALIFSEWLLGQRSISITKARIQYLDKVRGSVPLELTDVSLSYKRFWKQMQINASAQLPAEFGDRLTFIMDAQGDISTPQWSGQIYVGGVNILPGNLYTLYPDHAPQFKLSSAPADVELWSHWLEGKFTKLNGHITASNLDFRYNGAQQHIKNMDTLFTVIRDKDENLRLRLALKELETTNGPWPESTIDLYKQTTDTGNARYTARMNLLKIEDVIPLLRGLFPDFDNSINPDLVYTGMLDNTVLVFEPALASPLYFDVRVRKLDILHRLNGAKLTNLGGHVLGDINNGFMELNSSLVEIESAELFTDRLTFYEVAGDVKWSRNNNVLEFTLDNIESHTQHLNALLNGKISVATDTGLQTNLIFNASGLELQNVIHYLPQHVPVEVKDWVKSGLVSGQVTSLDMVLRGNPADIPFRNNEGQFKLVASIHDAIMDYHPDWTPVDRLDAELVIDNNALTIDAHRGYIYNAEITEAVAHISELDADKTSLVINGHIKGTTEDAIFIMNNSPLTTTSLNTEINKLNIKGNLNLDLGLEVPFYEKEISINGDLYFDQAVLLSSLLGIELNNIEGNLLFSSETLSTQSLSAEYDGRPVSMGISMDDQSRLLFSLTGDADTDYIATKLTQFFPELSDNIVQLKERMQGACSWTASLIPDPTQTTGVSHLLNISSDLSGLALDLPAPMGKGYEVMPLTITSDISTGTQKQIHLTAGDAVKSVIELSDSAANPVSRVEIAIGPQTTLLNDNQGLLIHGALDYLQLSDWHDFIDTLKHDTDNSPDDKVVVDLQITSLEYYGQILSNAHFSLNNLASGWQIAINSDPVEGTILVSGDSANETIKADFTRLYLQKEDDTGQEFNIDPRHQPAFELSAADFRYGDLELGKLQLNTAPTQQGMLINIINFDKPGLQIQGNGVWEVRDETEMSNIEFRLDATQLETMLTTFNYSMAPIKDGVTHVELNATWTGSPMDFSLANVNGEMEIKIEKGQFLDIEPAAGRLFGLLSLQTLPRRLSLDFSDLFGKGLSFDSIEGSFIIESGNAYTNNLALISPSANIDVTGRTGLIDKDYDQLVTITPQISDTFPLASAIFGPVGIGIGAVFYLAGELFESIPKQIDKILSYQYTITGSWEEPVVEKYKGNDESSG